MLHGFQSARRTHADREATTGADRIAREGGDGERVGGDRADSDDAGRTDGGERGGDRRCGERDIVVELYVRSLSPQGAADRQETVIDRLAALEEQGAIEAFSLIVWGPRFAPGSAAARTTTGRELGRRIDAFERWVAAAKKPDELAFECREVHSLVTDEKREEVVLPVLCLAVYQGETLRCVSPWRATRTTHSIDDCLDAIVQPGRVDGHPSITIDEAHRLRVNDDAA